MTFVAVGDRAEGRATEAELSGEGLQAQPRVGARTRGVRVTALTERVRAARGLRRVAVTEDGKRDTVRGRSPWTEGPASPAAVLAYTRSGAWVPGEQERWLERAGMAYGYLALAVTVVVAYPLWIVQRPSRFFLAVVLGGLLWLTWGR